MRFQRERDIVALSLKAVLFGLLAAKAVPMAAQCRQWSADAAVGAPRPQPRNIAVDRLSIGAGRLTLVDLRATMPDLAPFLESGGQVVLTDAATRRPIVILDQSNAADLQAPTTEPGVIAIGAARPAGSASASLLSSFVRRSMSYGESAIEAVSTPIETLVDSLKDLLVDAPRYPEPTTPVQDLFGLGPGSFIDPSVQQVIGGEVDVELAPPITTGRPPVIAPQMGTANLSTGDVADAVVSISFDNGPQKDRCNGIQFRTGFVLTNLHCALRGARNHVVHFGPLRQTSSGEWVGAQYCPATVFPVPSTYTRQRLDFAVLVISGGGPSAPYRNQVAQLDDGTLLRRRLQSGAGTAGARLVQYIGMVHQPQFGDRFDVGSRYVERPPSCSIIGSASTLRSEAAYCPAGPLVVAGQVGSGILAYLRHAAPVQWSLDI